MYRFFYKKDFYFLAYQRLKIKKKINFFGSDKKVTECLINKLRSQSFRFPVKKKETFCLNKIDYIENEIIQELIIILLESIYKPCFLTIKSTYKFCQSKDEALLKLKQNFSRSKWVKKTKKSQSFFNKQLFFQFLCKKIDDNSFINLIFKYLKSIDLKDLKVNNDLTLLLVNIYFYEFDKFIGNFQSKLLSSSNCQYSQLNVYYIRYAQSWVIGLNSSKAVSETTFKLIESFLRENYLVENSNFEEIDFIESTFIYFDYLVSVTNYSLKDSCDKNGLRRKNKRTIEFLIPISKIIFGLRLMGLCTSEGYPISKRSWTVNQDEVIVDRYNKILQKIFLKFNKADRKRPLLRVQYILQYSCAMTLAHKHKTTISKIFLKYGKNLEIKNLTTSYYLNILTINKLNKLNG